MHNVSFLITTAIVEYGEKLLDRPMGWHSAGIFTKPEGCREMLYYAYEHPWMIASQEH